MSTFLKLMVIRIPVYVLIPISLVVLFYYIHYNIIIKDLRSENSRLQEQLYIVKDNNSTLTKALDKQNQDITLLESKNNEAQLLLNNKVQELSHKLESKTLELDNYYKSLNLGSKCEDNLRWLNSRAKSTRW